MMRISALALWCSLIGWIIASSRPARAQDDEAANMPRAGATWPAEVQGIGRDTQKAKMEAVQEALKEFKIALAEMQPPIAYWTPTSDFVDRHLIEKPGYPGPDELVTLTPGDDKSKILLKTWIYPLRSLPLETLRQVDQKERLTQRSRDRQAWALRFIAAALVACLATLGVLHAGRRRK